MRECASAFSHRDQETSKRLPSWCQSPSPARLHSASDELIINVTREGTLTSLEVLTTTSPCHRDRDFIFRDELFLDLIKIGVDVDDQLLLVAFRGWVLVTRESNFSTMKLCQ